MRDVIRNVLLVVGAVTIIVSGLFTLSHLTDRVIFTVLVPGFVFGLIFIGIGMSVGRERWRWFG